MGKFWKNNKAVISGTLIAALAIGGFISLGYYYSNSNVGYDYVGVGAQVDSLNYNTGTGNTYRITTMMNEGLITPTTDFKTLQTKITAALNDAVVKNDEGIDVTGYKNFITANDLVSIDEYELATEYVLIEYAKDYLGSRTLFEELNDNEKTLVILASDSIKEDKSTKELIVDEESKESLDNATGILAHARPMTYIGDEDTELDDDGNILNEEEWDPNSDKMISAYAYGVADLIYTTKEYKTFRFRLRDGSLENGVSTWQTWNDNGVERNDRVSAADVAFGFSRQIPSMYGSSGRYMYTSIAQLKGSNEAYAADKEYGITDENRYKNESGENLDEKSVDNWTSLDAIQYALAPDDSEFGYTRDAAITEDENFVAFDVAGRDSGIIYHDPVGHEDSAVDANAEDYSYIDFNVMDGSVGFPTMMSSTGFWPINWEWFIKTIGRPGFDELNEFGTSAETILSNGAQQVTEFDNLYGYTTKKNHNYYDADLVTVEKGSYRMVTEASTQVAMFDNGDATYIDGADSNSKSIMDSEIASAWLPEKFTKPATKFMFFNLGTDRLATRGDVAPFTSDPNFRRAFAYAFNTNVYHELNSTDTAYAVSTFEPAGMYSDAAGNDLVDYMTDTTYTSLGTDEIGGEIDESKPLNEQAPVSEQLEYFNYDDRKEAVGGIDLSQPDPTQNYALADYYFEIFLDDMAQLGVTVPKTITLKYLTSVGPNDPFIKTIQQQVSTHEYPGGYHIELQIEQVASGVFFANYYAADYDLASIQWSADYLDSWSNIGIFNISENSRGGNSLGGWNLWDGSDYTFDDTTYGSAENAEKARALFNDGFKQFYEQDGANANITSVEFNAVSDYSGTTVFDTYTTSQFKAISDQLWNATLADNGITSWTEDLSLGNTEDAENPTFGLSYNKHTEDIWGDGEKSLAANILLELILKDGAATVTGTTESGSISPTRALLEGDPVIGYCSRTFSFDLTKSKGFWDSVDKELREEFYKK